MVTKRGYLRGIANIFLRHTYTLTTKVASLDGDNQPIFDDNGNQVYVDSDPEPDKKCLFLWEEVFVSDDRGSGIVRSPTLYADWEDTITEGDNVSNIVDEDGIVLLTAATVQTVNPTAESGGVVLKVCRLIGARTA